MKLFITLSKKSLAAVLAAVIIALILLGQFFTVRSAATDGSTNALRVAYLTGLGYKIDDSAVKSKCITIPQDFSEVYLRYNVLQKKAGFDLSDYKGKQAEIYTYNIIGDPETVINVIICGDAVIGGDVSSVRIDGEMTPLLPENS